MRNFAAVAFAVTLASLSAAKADVPGPDWMPMEQSHESATRRLLNSKPMTVGGKAKASKTDRSWNFTLTPKPASSCARSQTIKKLRPPQLAAFRLLVHFAGEPLLVFFSALFFFNPSPTNSPDTLLSKLNTGPSC